MCCLGGLGSRLYLLVQLIAWGRPHARCLKGLIRFELWASIYSSVLRKPDDIKSFGEWQRGKNCRCLRDVGFKYMVANEHVYVGVSLSMCRLGNTSTM